MKVCCEGFGDIQNTPLRHEGTRTGTRGGTAVLRPADVLDKKSQAGLAVTVMDSTKSSEDRIVLLIKPTQARLQAERHQMRVERWFEMGAVGDLPDEMFGTFEARDGGIGEWSAHHRNATGCRRAGREDVSHVLRAP